MELYIGATGGELNVTLAHEHVVSKSVTAMSCSAVVSNSYSLSKLMRISQSSSQTC